MQEPETKLELDLLKSIETLTERVNKMMGKSGRSAFRRYPLTFTLLVLFGIVAVTEGAKGLLEEAGLADRPRVMFAAGLLILIITGTLYKKLDRE